MKVRAYIGWSLLSMMLFVVLGCQRAEPELINGSTDELKTIRGSRFFEADTLHWTFNNRTGNFYSFSRDNAAVPLPQKGDYVVYHDQNHAFFGQLIGLEVSNTQVGMELTQVPVNDLFDFFAYRDTIMTVNNHYRQTTDSLVQQAGDTLKISGVKRSIRQNAFLRGIIDFQEFALYDIGAGEQFFYLTPEWNNGVLTRDALIKWNQDLVVTGQLILTQFDNNAFQDSLKVRTRTWTEEVDGFYVDFITEEWLALDWQFPDAGTITVQFSLTGESDYSLKLDDGGSWIQTSASNWSGKEISLDGWNKLKPGFLNIRYVCTIKPVFNGREGLKLSKETALNVLATSEWPQWDLTGELIQTNVFDADYGLFSDLSSSHLTAEAFREEILNNQGELINEVPVANFTISPPSGYTNTSFKLNGGLSTDVEDKTEDLRVRWDFTNDGGWDTNYSTTKLVNHQYISAGVYTVRMEVIDTQGATDEITRQVTVYETSSAPIAAFTVTPETGSQSQPFTFDASACYDAEDALNLLQVRWDFENDGKWDYDYSTTKAAVWIFGQPGEYVVKLEVKDTDGLTGSTTRLVRVTVGNTKPEAYFVVDPENGTTETRFNYDASGSSDAEDDVEDLQVRWDFENDGVWDTEWRTIKSVTHQFEIAGNYTSLLQVQDTEGFTNTFTRVIRVTNPNTAPKADFTVNPAKGDTSTKFQFDASISSDLEDPVSALEVRWDWDNDDIWDSAYSTVKTASMQFSAPGTYIVRVQVRDSGGLTNIRAKLVVVE